MNHFSLLSIDNGKGFDSSKFHILEGFGLNQIKARLNHLRGTVEINSKPNLGTSITINVPITYQKKITQTRFSISIISKSLILSPSITKRKHSSYLVKTTFTRCTRIHVQKIKFFIENHF